MEKASHCRPIAAGIRAHSLSALTHPRPFILARPFALVWLLYAATYTVANTVDTLGHEFHAAATGTLAFLCTSLVNVPLGLWKDLRFAQIYGAGNAADRLAQKAATAPLSRDVRAQVRVPKAAAAAFLLRDGITIFGSFTLPPMVAGLTPDALVGDAHAKAALAQIAVPVLSQVVATPVHVLGISLYQRQSGMAFRDRMARVARDLPATTVARCSRIVPAFGFGVLANNEMRAFFHGAFRTAGSA